MADALQILGQNQSPADLETGKIQVVVDLTHYLDSFSQGKFLFLDSGLIDKLVGATGYRQQIVYNDLGEATNWILPLGAYRFDALELALVFDAAGLAAIAGTEIYIDLLYVDVNGDPSTLQRIWTGLFKPRNGTPKEFYWAIGGGIIRNLNTAGVTADVESYVVNWNGAVPLINPLEAQNGKGLGLALHIYNLSGTNFPANTTYQIKAFVRQGLDSVVPSSLR